MSARDRSLATISARIASGAFGQLPVHLQRGKENGLTGKEVSESITHLSFYVGWPKAWSAFMLAKDLFGDEEMDVPQELGTLFDTGEPNPYGEFFTGKSYLYLV